MLILWKFRSRHIPNGAFPQRLLIPTKEIPWRRPYGTPGPICGLRFPTLKRGANERCAYGANIRTFHMQREIRPTLFCGIGSRALPNRYRWKRHLLYGLEILGGFGEGNRWKVLGFGNGAFFALPGADAGSWSRVI